MMYPQFKQLRLAELINEQWGAERIPGLLDLINYTQPRRVLEIGSFRGVSTEVFLLHAAHVTCIDPWPDDKVFLDFGLRAGHYPHLTTLRGKSPHGIGHIPRNRFDLAYIDGDHSESAVAADIFECQRLVRPGGWIAGHDYGGPGTPDVKKVVDGMFRQEQIIIFSDSSWAVQNEKQS